MVDLFHSPLQKTKMSEEETSTAISPPVEESRLAV